MKQNSTLLYCFIPKIQFTVDEYNRPFIPSDISFIDRILNIKFTVSGYHEFEKILDSLVHSSGPILCIVELYDNVYKEDGTAYARLHKTLWMKNVEKELHEFACQCIERALLHERAAGREPDRRSWRVLETKRRWLKGEATIDELEQAEKDAKVAVDVCYNNYGNSTAYQIAYSTYRFSSENAVVAAFNAYITAAETDGRETIDRQWQEELLLGLIGLPLLNLIE